MEVAKKFLQEHPQCEIIRVCWIDLSNVVKFRNVTVDYFLEIVGGRGWFTGTCIDTLLPITQELTDWVWPHLCDRVKIYPDLSSLRIVQSDPLDLKNNAVVMCKFEEPNQKFDRDTRPTLQRTITRAASDHGLKFLVGWELEFVFLSKENEVPSLASNNAVPAHGDQMAHAFRSPYFAVWNQIQRALRSAKVPIQQFHGEHGDHQFEISTGPLPPMEAVDALIFTRETIKDVAYKQGFRVTFFPAAPGGTNGLHTHLSIHPAGPDAAPAKEDEFVGGLLEQWPAICAFGMTNVDSYTRIVHGYGVQGLWVAYGTENRETPIRKIKEAHWELRTNDSTSNPYLFLSAAMSAGMDGYGEGRKLMYKNLDRKSALSCTLFVLCSAIFVIFPLSQFLRDPTPSLYLSRTLYLYLAHLSCKTSPHSDPVPSLEGQHPKSISLKTKPRFYHRPPNPQQPPRVHPCRIRHHDPASQIPPRVPRRPEIGEGETILREGYGEGYDRGVSDDQGV